MFSGEQTEAPGNARSAVHARRSKARAVALPMHTLELPPTRAACALPGPDRVKCCPTCQRHVAEPTLAAGSTFGATWWSDGKCEAPMLLDLPRLVRCPHCRAFIWRDRVAALGTAPPLTSGTGGAVARVLVPAREDYLAFLERRGRSKPCERYARVRAWWASNDRWRGVRGAPPQPAAPDLANLERLLLLLGEQRADERLMKAEVLRELGRFDEAAAILAACTQPRQARIVAALRRWLAQGDSAVQHLQFV
jgi:hypothetical protein